MSLPHWKINRTMKPSTDCYDLIKKWEGLRLESYLCPSNIWTIGYGHTGEEAQPNSTITEIEAYQLLTKDVAWASDAANSLFNNLLQQQFDAIVSIIFNMGKRGFIRNKLCTMIMHDPDDPKIKDEWQATGIRNSKGTVLKGLQNRRFEEVKLYFKQQ